MNLSVIISIQITNGRNFKRSISTGLCTLNEEVTKKIIGIDRGSNWRPRYYDLKDASTILIRIQDTYDLNVTEV